MSKKMKKNRILTMVFGAVAIFFTGYPHVWSVYAPDIIQKTGWSQTQSSMCFYLVLFAFVFGNIIGGRIQDQSNPLLVLSSGGILQAAGVILSSFLVAANPLPMYLTYGIMHGFGQGMVYTVILSTAQKWFPKRKGFASGVVVTANGLCGFFLAPLSRKIIGTAGPERALLTVGILMAAAWILSIIFVKIPPAAAELDRDTDIVSENKVFPYTSGEMLRTKKFYFLAAAMMFGLVSYFLISPSSQTLQIQRGVSQTVAVSAVMFGSVMNAGARLIIPTLADKAGRVICIKLILIISAIAMGSLAISNSYGTTIGIIIMFGCYGGIMGSFPAFTSSIFGMQHSGENYGYVMLGVVAATMSAPVLLKMTGETSGDQRVIFLIGAGCAALAWILIRVLNKELEQKGHHRRLSAESQ